MKKSFLKIVAVFMAVIMTAVYLPLSEIDTFFDVEASALTSNNNAMSGSNAKWSYDTSSKVLTISGSGAMTNYTDTPDAFADYNWKLVVTIMNNARSIVINNGITTIGNFVFKGFKNVTSVSIPASVTTIGSNAFRDCTSLASISVPSSVKTIGAGAFRGCTALKSFSIPSGVTVINNDTFYGCSSLSSVNINEGITSIGANAFRDTKVSSVNMPYSVKSIGGNAFSTVKITCNYGDPAYNYCKSHANATAVLRTPSLRVEIAQGSAADLIKVSLYVQDASGMNAGNFTVEYNADISPVSSDYTFSENGGVSTAVVYGSNNKVSVAVASLTEVAYSDCTDKCSYKIAELSFRLAQGTHVAKVTLSSTVFMLAGNRYTPASAYAEFGDHIFQPVGNPVPATCTTYGYTLKKCTICKEEREFDIVPELGHVYDDGVVTPSTCEDSGYTSYTCSRCKDVRKDNFTEETGHSMKDVVIPATCKVKGEKKTVCENCEKSLLIEEYEINPDNHVNTELVNVKDSTCSEKGYTGDTKCTDCDKIIATGTKTDTIAHTYNSVVTAPTCTAKGYTTHTCTVCSYSYKDSETSMVAHKYESVVTAPTCVAKGYTTHTCSVCSYSYKDSEIPTADHSYVKTVTKAPTCQAKGVAEYKCSVCEAKYTEDLAVTDHDYNAVVTAPTCMAGGYTTYTCKHCDASYKGAETGVVDHNFVETSKTEATCTEYGSTTYTCSFCGETKKVDGDKLGSHDYESLVTAPTCTTAGYTTYTCKYCDRSYKDAPTVALGHEYDEDGYCVRCNEHEMSAALAFNDTANFIINEEDKTVLVRKTLTAAELKAAITTEGWIITTADGTAAADDKAVATSYLIKSADGSLVYAVAILGDITCDGKVTAADARIALRVTARIDKAEPIAVLAADCDGKANLSASDARIILRVSARVQTF